MVDDALRAGLEALAEQITTAVRANDWDAFAALHTDDAVRHAPDMPPMVGRDAIRATHAVMRVAHFEQELEHVDGEGDLGVVTARYEIRFRLDGEGEAREEGHVHASARRGEDGRWRITSAMTTPRVSPPAS